MVNIEPALVIHGLCTTHEELKRLAELADGAEYVAEIGSYMGRSTKALALATAGKVFAIDTWYGSEEDEEGEKTRAVPPDELYAAFIRNMRDEIISGKVIPLRCDSVQGANLLQDYKFDVIFLDAGHDYEWVTRDIKAWLPLLKQGGVMIGHDLPHPRMVEALDELLSGWHPSVGMLWEYRNVVK